MPLPDVIYIHNPYDECNHVTSVYPYFYSKNLINFTDKLVYIPCFVLKEIEPDNQKAIDCMKHFCFTPGTIYAHKVIVQSEKMRRIYINPRDGNRKKIVFYHTSVSDLLKQNEKMLRKIESVIEILKGSMDEIGILRKAGKFMMIQQIWIGLLF